MKNFVLATTILFIFCFVGACSSNQTNIEPTVETQYEEALTAIPTQIPPTQIPVSKASPSDSVFVYADKCALDMNTSKLSITEGFYTENGIWVGAITYNETCFEPSSADYSKVCNDYGCFDLQTFADRWPGKATSETIDGVESRSAGNPYYGFQQKRVGDNIDFNNLSPMEKVGHWAANGVVQVIADRCFGVGTDKIEASPTLQVYSREGKWIRFSEPVTGFFIAPNLVMAPISVINDFAHDKTGEIRLQNGWIHDDFAMPGSGLQADMTCTEYTDYSTGNAHKSIEVGAGPFIQMFNGEWGAGSVIATDQKEGHAIIRIDRPSKNGDKAVKDWDPWNEKMNPARVLSIAPPEYTPKDALLTIHHPADARTVGGWHVTTGQILDYCETWVQDNDPNTLFVDFWGDTGSVGAPVLDESGRVIGIYKKPEKTHPDACGEINKSKNQLGVLSSFLADPAEFSVVRSTKSFHTFLVDAVGDKLSSNLEEIKGTTEWPANALSPRTARYESIKWGDDFTVSGFPVKELQSEAFDIARQATVMFIREMGCTACSASKITEDFSGGCLCTGFAVTKNLIITNDHCVVALAIGGKATFLTYSGQLVEAELIGRSHFDGRGTSDSGVPDYDPYHKGDVALLRTAEMMNLTPVRLGNSDKLKQYDPLISVGHPGVMIRSGPFVTVAGSFIGKEMEYSILQHYTLPSSRGASGSGIFNLQGEVVGQLSGGSLYHQAEEKSILISKYGRGTEDISINPDQWAHSLNPRTFSVGPRVDISSGQASYGATSNYIRSLIGIWAPGELS